MADTTTLEEITPVTEGANATSAPLAEATPEVVVPALTETITELQRRLDAAESTIAQLVAHAQAPLQMSLGPAEIAAIADALKPAHEQHIRDFLQAHFRMSGHPAVG